MKAVFLDQDTFSTQVSLKRIAKQVTALKCYQQTQASQVVERSLDAEVLITNKVVLDNKILAQLPKLKLICISATGINNIDLLAAQQHHIAVTNVSGYAKQSVAQYVFAQLLNYFSQPNHHIANVTHGQWQQSTSFCLHGNGSSELAGKTIGIIGYGSLGQAVAQIAHAFGMKVMISERPNAAMVRTNRKSFNQVIREADILTLHCPQTPATENLIDAQVLSEMKSSAVLINTARGALVNEQDLLTALKQNDIAYAILDVLSEEPPKANHLLLQNQPKNLAITGHIAWASIEAQQRLLDLVGDNIAAFKQGQTTNRVDL
ncbi:lactate dehydrogenase [Thalassotalea insulae]|uniref:Lactate dehydrogenase n=1 Tax=Thalassotalea insulae TaxID=2056778 RepID=A0ABQ6GVL2_9GAMM|nr:D-2-hydroxyacid dehydrogenase [Thalassotalea insulae]GLX79384.1 lactate dehydrogenase [Thalassotalea insulae]